MVIDVLSTLLAIFFLVSLWFYFKYPKNNVLLVLMLISLISLVSYFSYINSNPQNAFLVEFNDEPNESQEPLTDSELEHFSQIEELRVSGGGGRSGSSGRSSGGSGMSSGRSSGMSGSRGSFSSGGGRSFSSGSGMSRPSSGGSGMSSRPSGGTRPAGSVMNRPSRPSGGMSRPPNRPNHGDGNRRPFRSNIWRNYRNYYPYYSYGSGYSSWWPYYNGYNYPYDYPYYYDYDYNYPTTVDYAPNRYSVRLVGNKFTILGENEYGCGNIVDNLTLQRGQTYEFEIYSSADCQTGQVRNEPFFFTTSPQGGNAQGKVFSVNPTMNGVLRITITNDVPSVFYYQSTNTKFVGGKITVV